MSYLLTLVNALWNNKDIHFYELNLFIKAVNHILHVSWFNVHKWICLSNSTSWLIRVWIINNKAPHQYFQIILLIVQGHFSLENIFYFLWVSPGNLFFQISKVIFISYFIYVRLIKISYVFRQNFVELLVRTVRTSQN